MFLEWMENEFHCRFIYSIPVSKYRLIEIFSMAELKIPDYLLISSKKKGAKYNSNLD